MRFVSLEKHGTRVRLDTKGDCAALDIRDTYPSEKLGELFHGGIYWLSPSEALEIAGALTVWAERQRQLRRAKYVRAKARKEAASRAPDAPHPR